MYSEKYYDFFTGKIWQTPKRDRSIRPNMFKKKLIWKIHKIQPKEIVMKSFFS